MSNNKEQKNDVKDLVDALVDVRSSVLDVRFELEVFQEKAREFIPRTKENQKELERYYKRRYVARDKVYEAIDRALSLIPALAPYVQYMPDVNKDEYMALLRKNLQRLRADLVRNGAGHCEVINIESPKEGQMAWLSQQVENIGCIDTAVYNVANTKAEVKPDENGFMDLKSIDVGAYISKVDIINKNTITETSLDRILTEHTEIRKCRAFRTKNGEYKPHKRRLLIHRLDIEKYLR